MSTHSPQVACDEETPHLRACKQAKKNRFLASRNDSVLARYCGNWNVEVWPFRFSMTKPSEFVTVLIVFCWM
jgi:hypothetical protein